MPLTWQEALELVIERTGHELYRAACADGHPQAELWRARMLEKAGQPTPEFPPIMTQAGNALGAIGRVAGAVLTGRPVYVSQEERNRRLAICQACEYFVDNRCRRCGCFALAKIELATEACPIGKWLRSESGGS